MMMKNVLCALGVLAAVPAFAQDKSAAPAETRKPVTMIKLNGPGFPGPPGGGISAELMEQLDLPKSTVSKAQDLLFASNDQLITLEADHKRAQLTLERELKQDSPNEATVKDLVEKVGRAETAVRQNRVGVMVSLKKLLGPDAWSKLQALRPAGPALPPPPFPPAPPAKAAPPAPAAQGPQGASSPSER